jgi:phytoene dehydrogenase-like protein
MSSRYDIVVIGAGHNGLTAAALLAKRGQKVLVLERRDVVGGLSAGEEFHPGYHTTGVLHDTSGVRRWVLDELELDKYGLELSKSPPAVLVPQREGTGYLYRRDPEQAYKEIAAFSESDADNYYRYRSFLHRITPVFRKVLDDLPPDVDSLGLSDLWDLGKKAISLRLLGKTDMMEIFRIAPMCVADWLNEWFDTELIKAAMAAPAIHNTFAGPWSPGSNLNLLLAETQGETTVVGGPQALQSALAKAAAAQGAEVRTSAPVRQVNIESSKAWGVTLADGEVVEAAKILASCHPQHLFLDLIAPRFLPFEFQQNVERYRTRGTAAKIDLALSSYPEFSCRPDVKAEIIRTGETLDDLERAFDPIKYRQFSERPVLDVWVPTVESSALAPEGHHVFSILVHFAPYELEGGWSEAKKEELYEAAVDVLAEYAPGIRQAVVGRQILSPADLEERYGVSGGHLHHGEHSTDQLLSRPTPECVRYRTPFPGLFLCGSGSHPGGGITCAPGGLAARSIL